MIKRLLDWLFLRDFDRVKSVGIGFMDAIELREISARADKATERLRRKIVS